VPKRPDDASAKGGDVGVGERHGVDDHRVRKVKAVEDTRELVRYGGRVERVEVPRGANERVVAVLVKRGQPVPVKVGLRHLHKHGSPLLHRHARNGVECRVPGWRVPAAAAAHKDGVVESLEPGGQQRVHQDLQRA